MSEQDYDKVICCKNCKHYSPPKAGDTCGKCDYPVPEYLKAASSSFIGHPEYSGRECAVFQSSLISPEAMKDE
jgi:hypothetical protein